MDINKKNILQLAKSGMPYIFKSDLLTLTIQPKTIGDILNYGWIRYQGANGVLLFSKERFIENARKESTEDGEKTFVESLQGEKSHLSSFEVVLLLTQMNPDFANSVKSCYSFFLDCIIEIDFEKGCLIAGLKDEKIVRIYGEDFNNINEILKIQNNLSDQQEDEGNYDLSNERVRQLLEKRRIGREKVAKAKAKDREEMDYAQMLQLLATIKNCFVKDIKENVYILEFYQQFEIYNKKTNYELGIQRLLAGDKPEKVKLEHWFN